MPSSAKESESVTWPEIRADTRVPALLASSSLMLVSVTAWLVGRGYGLNAEQLPSAVDSPAHAGVGWGLRVEGWGFPHPPVAGGQ